MQLLQYCLLVTARLLYMFRTLSASIIRSTKNCSSSHWCISWVGMIYIQGNRPWTDVQVGKELPDLHIGRPPTQSDIYQMMY
jgi:hypothetical protein